MPKTYVDNAYNRSLGRVGMTHGSMVVSRGSSSSGSSFGNFSSGASGSSGRSSFGGVSSGSYGSSDGAVKTTKTYVDNTYNRSLGRVGMEHGSMVVSKSSSSNGSNVVRVSGRDKSGISDSHVRMPKTYVDNDYNSRLGRVGMEHGTMVVSRSSSSSGSSAVKTTKSYVDNEYNRRLGRVGMEHGTMVISRSSSSSFVGDSGRTKSGLSDGTSHRTNSLDKYTSEKVYANNRLNRSLGRVGKPKGTAIYRPNKDKSKAGLSDGDVSHRDGPIVIPPTAKVYKDNPLNRSLGRVGKPLGSMPFSRKSKQVQEAQEIVGHFENDTYDDAYERNYDPDPHALEIALSLINRKLEEMTWAQEQNNYESLKTKNELVEEYSGDVIQFEDIQLGRIIGHGGFGDVYFARWKGSVVAVKKLRLQRVSNRRLREFMNEITIFCGLDHPNIVKFIGACTKTPNLSIVMEYMQMSLFDALHMDEEIDFSEEERLQIIKQTCSGIEYLHECEIVHCDLKSQNVLLDYVPEETCVAKITDFGLSVIKSNTETSVSGSEMLMCNVGTPKYSAPEVLRGERLSTSDMMRADVYSLSLIIYEVISEEEPFYDFTCAQLLKQVGDKGTLPDFPSDIKIDRAVERMIRLCLSFNSEKRPIVQDINSFFKTRQNIYIP